MNRSPPWIMIDEDGVLSLASWHNVLYIYDGLAAARETLAPLMLQTAAVAVTPAELKSVVMELRERLRLAPGDPPAQTG